MNPVVPFLLFATFVTGSHAAFLTFAKGRMRFDRSLRLRWWNRHLLLNGVLWLVVFGWTFLLAWLLPREATTGIARLFGSILFALGIALVVKARLLLGRDQAMGVRFFLPERARRIESSLYRYARNPMYDGFLLLLVGMGFALGVKEYFIVALASFVLLNLLLARVENFETRLNPF